MANVVMYSTAYCPYCMRARQLLEQKGVIFEEIRVDLYPEKREQMIEKSGGYTVPQLFINDVAIGGCDELYALEAQGRLDDMLKEKG
jgi:glutaredoxin 3